MAKKPTAKQIEAYRLVYIHDCKHAQAAELMRCSRSNVSHLLKNLKKHNSALFIKNKPNNRIFSLNQNHDSQIIRKF